MIGRDFFVMIRGKVADENATVGRTYREIFLVQSTHLHNCYFRDFTKVKVTQIIVVED